MYLSFLYRILHFKVLPTNSTRGAEHIAGSGASEHPASPKDNYLSAPLPRMPSAGSNNKFPTTWINEKPTLSTRAGDATLHLSLFKRSATRCHVTIIIIQNKQT